VNVEKPSEKEREALTKTIKVEQLLWLLRLNFLSFNVQIDTDGNEILQHLSKLVVEDYKAFADLLSFLIDFLGNWQDDYFI